MAVLSDLLEPNLITVICGRAVGKKSAEVRAPYANPGNKFWKILAEIGLTDHKLDPHDYQRLLNFRIGLTDLNKTEIGVDKDINQFADNPVALMKKVEFFRPKILAFNGKKSASVFCKWAFQSRNISYGLQEEQAGNTQIFVLPSTSGLASKFWEPRYWQEMATLHNRFGQ